MGTELHWVDGPWPGKPAVASRPRGGDWLEDEIASWRRAGIDTVLSLLAPDEELDVRGGRSLALHKLLQSQQRIAISERRTTNSNGDNDQRHIIDLAESHGS
jgi:hypothetical protein